MRRFLILAVSGIASAISMGAVASDTRLGCLTQRVWLREGVPPVMIVNFDEQASTASVFAKELGGILQGRDVVVSDDTIMFKIKTISDEPGEVLITRGDGTLMLKVARQPEIKILADCRKQTNRF